MGKAVVMGRERGNRAPMLTRRCQSTNRVVEVEAEAAARSPVELGTIV